MADLDPLQEERVTERLLTCAEALHTFISGKTPARFAATVSADDVLQEVWVMAFRQADFVLAAAPAELNVWLRTVADHKLADAVKAQRRAKRGADRVVHQSAIPGNSRWSFAALRMWDLSKQRTPSSESATVEATDVVNVALAGLADDQRTAVRMRHVDGRSLEEIANAMGRSVVAVNGLVFRGLRQLRRRLGRAGRYFTDSGSMDMPEPRNQVRARAGH